MADEREEVIISFGDLNVGELYPIQRAVVEMRKFGNKSVESVKIDISSSEVLRTCTYLPSGPLRFAIANIDNINAAYENKKPYHACYYGSIGSSSSKANEMRRYIGKVHKPGEGVIADLLRDVTKTDEMVTASAKKRPASTQDPVSEPSTSKSSRADDVSPKSNDDNSNA